MPAPGRAAALAGRAERLATPVFTALAVLAALAGAAIVALIGASVVMRHLANAPFRFTEELVGLLMTAAFFLALPLVTLKSEHVRVRILVDALPPSARVPAAILAGLLGIAFCAWFTALCLPWMDFALRHGIRTEAARLPMSPWMALLPVSLVLSGVAFAIRAVAGSADEDD